jgi:hypothetical protein
MIFGNEFWLILFREYIISKLFAVYTSILLPLMHQASIDHSNTCYASHHFNTLPLLPLFQHMYVLPSLLAHSTYSPRFSPFQHTPSVSRPFNILIPLLTLSPLLRPPLSRPFNVFPLLLILAFNTFPLLLTLSTYSPCFSPFKHAHPASHPSTYTIQTSYKHFPPTISTLYASICFLLFLTNSICFSSF